MFGTVYLFDKRSEALVLHRLLHNRVEEHAGHRLLRDNVFTRVASQKDDVHGWQPAKKNTGN